ncbi:Transposon Ty3-G Gag-Pol polyprotein [Vitis vinifera]|uniref:Transposon Ty3-G Gag-Pol polyprotein n=1 Tax=Vitis vinifera TaxID=29760 RepID=A0A438HHI0_VITVI|nr:Transposon Ty3-G Gag-Pol polyprotein [Vitis vinifera]
MSMEDYFDWYAMPENRKVRFVKAKLKGAARLWWHNIENQVHRTGQPPIDTWDEMKLKMKEHFLPTDYEQVIDAQLAARYKAGLRMKIQLEMIATHTYTVDDVYQLALKIEKGLKFRVSRRPSSQIGSPFSNRTTSKPLSTTNFRTSNHVNGGSNTQQTSNVTYKNGNKGKNSMSNGDRKVDVTPLCFKCGGHGHYAVVCPTKSLHFCVEEPESELESYPKEEETYNEDEVSEECDYDGMTEGHSLVVRPLLTVPKVKGEEDWRRTSIFQTRISCQGRLCTMIIDGGNNLNIASQELVEKLNLKTERHPNPFRVAWVNDTFIPLPNELPPMRNVQHAIDLIPGASLLNLPTYRMNPTKHAELKRQVDELLTKGFIRESLSPCGVPALLTPKKDGSWRMCVDSRAINKITIKYRFPIPRLDDMLDMMVGSDGLYEWLVMSFGLTNAPSTFMRIMTQGVETDPEKIKAIVDWPVPTNIHEAANKAFEEIKSKMVNPLSPHLEIEYVLDDQLVSTRQGGYQNFLLKWRGKPHSENTWSTTTDFHKLNPDLYELYQASNSSEPSSFKPGRID